MFSKFLILCQSIKCPEVAIDSLTGSCALLLTCSAETGTLLSFGAPNKFINIKVISVA